MSRPPSFLFGLVLMTTACGAKSAYDPPAEPPHNDVEEDWVEGLGQVSSAHASGKSTPYLCRDPDGGWMTCPDTPVEPRYASCDAAGCHGGFTFVEGADDPDRHLDGSDGPSCWTCHDREWSTRTSP